MNDINYARVGGLASLGLVTLFAAFAANMARDDAYLVNALIVMLTAGGMLLYYIRKPIPAPGTVAPVETGYMDGPIRVSVIATILWGVVGFLAGTYIAFQLAFPDLNWSLSYLQFGRLRPLHTSAVIFAFGGSALIASSFYIVQRTCAARLWGGNLAWFVVWGYQFFIVLAATSYVFGGSTGREYAEPTWYIDLWLTVVWVAFLAVFLGTLIKRKEPHI
ncbi:MAG: cbb3-type cytochrome c oxidase subunit I, partial [Pseudomonadota bacterium]